ncbi:MAG: ethanolamine utilization microcompartment protein EutL [Clostridiales bacterium]|jgi:ethanolamine utilization protein EutL|nr:ethanolamine utilization microcompartment protein EutL [Clostridiales bacterium]
MRHDPIKTNILSVKIIPNADPMILRSLGVLEHERSLGIITTDCDDVSYAALDEATKKARVRVVYARSMYAGSGNASTKLAGEFVGVIAADEPEEVRSGLQAAISFMENDSFFYSAADDDSIIYFAHCISRTGSFLSSEADVTEGIAMAYLIAPPMEALLGLDAALKAADVELKVFYGPPTETNFAGGLLVGDQAACKAACEAFADSVCETAENPLVF